MMKEGSALQLYAPWFGHVSPIHFNGNYMPSYKDNFENMFENCTGSSENVCYVDK